MSGKIDVVVVGGVGVVLVVGAMVGSFSSLRFARRVGERLKPKRKGVEKGEKRKESQRHKQSHCREGILAEGKKGKKKRKKEKRRSFPQKRGDRILPPNKLHQPSLHQPATTSCEQPILSNR